jgi:hypothetical protein
MPTDAAVDKLSPRPRTSQSKAYQHEVGGEPTPPAKSDAKDDAEAARAERQE